MATPPPTKPPRREKYGKESSICGPLMTVIKTLDISETPEEREKEKAKIEREFKKTDQRLSELISKHDGDLTQVIQLFSQVSSIITDSRERIRQVKENLTACKSLLGCKREELRQLWSDALRQKFVLEMLQQIESLRKVSASVTSYSSKRHYLHATKTLTEAIQLSNGRLKEVEGLCELRSDLDNRKEQLYQKMLTELSDQIYENSTGEVLNIFKRQSSGRNSSNFQRAFVRRSTDRAEANEKVRKALQEMTQTFDPDKTEIIQNVELLDPQLKTTYFIGIIVECFAMLNKVPESIETIKVKIQTELLDIIAKTTQEMISLDLMEMGKHPLLSLLDVIYKQFKSIAQSHQLLIKNYLSVMQRYGVTASLYDIADFWTQAQAVFQLLLTDYLDIQNASGDETTTRTNFNEPTTNINAFFSRRKTQSKKSLFKFEKALHIVPQDVGASSSSKEHRRNLSDMSNDELLLTAAGEKKTREKVLVCQPDASLIRKIFLPLMQYILEIQVFMKCKSGQQCSLDAFLSNYVKDTFLAKGHNRNLQLTIESLSKNHDAWRAIISPEEMKELQLSRPLLQSTVMVEKRISETRELIQDLPVYSDDLLKMVCSLLKTYRETCQAAYRGIVQPDAEDKRIYSVAWLKDEDISRFLKTLPNWTDLKTSSHRAKLSRKLQKGYEASEEESPTQIQNRNIREAEMLTSNLGEGGISQSEILSDVSVLKELSILQESMEWFSSRISEFANDLRRPIVNPLTAGDSTEYGSVSIHDGTIKVLTNLALEFDELANTCLLVLHLEVRVQCFHYLRSSNPKLKKNNYLVPNDDTLEPDTRVLKLTKVLSDMDEALSATLHPRKTRYIFEGLAHLCSRILIQASNYMETIDHSSIQKMCRNALALQTTLSSITACREVALDQARQFYELLCMEPNEILTNIVEKGSQFTEMQYLNALHLSSKARGITDLNSLASYQQKLSDILGSKPGAGVIV